MFIVDYATYVFLGRFFLSLGQENSIFQSDFGPGGRSARPDHCIGHENLPLSRFGPSWPQFRPTGHELVTGRAELLKNFKIKFKYCGLELVTWQADLPNFLFLGRHTDRKSYLFGLSISSFTYRNIELFIFQQCPIYVYITLTIFLQVFLIKRLNKFYVLYIFSK